MNVWCKYCTGGVGDWRVVRVSEEFVTGCLLFIC